MVERANIILSFGILEMLLVLLRRSFGLKYIKAYILNTLFSGLYLEPPRRGQDI